MWALWRFSPNVPRPRGACECHTTDHDRFLRCMWLMDLWVWVVQEEHHVEVPAHLLGIGYCCWVDTRRAGWPSCSGVSRHSGCATYNGHRN